MKEYNLDLHNDIIKLRELNKTSPAEFKKLVGEMLTKHKLSKTTLYRELGKPVPGKYTRREHKPEMSKITNLELECVAEMMVNQKPQHEMLKEMSLIKGFEYSEVRLAKAKQKVFLAAQKINDPKPKIVHHIYNPKTIGGMKISKVEYNRADGKEGITPKDPKLPKSTGDVSKFFYELAGIDIKDPDGIHKLSFPSGEAHYVKTSVIRGCLDQIAASSVAGGKSNEDSLNFAIDSLLRNQLNKALSRGYITPLELRQLASTRRVLNQVRATAGPAGGYYSFDEVMMIVGVFAPSTSRESVARIIASHPFLDRNRSKPAGEYKPIPENIVKNENERNGDEIHAAENEFTGKNIPGMNNHRGNHVGNHVGKAGQS